MLRRPSSVPVERRARSDSAISNPAAYSRRFTARLAVFLIFVTVAYLFCVTFFPVPGGKYADMIVPSLLASVVSTIVSFFYQVAKQRDPETPGEQRTSTTVQAPATVETTVTPGPAPISSPGPDSGPR